MRKTHVLVERRGNIKGGINSNLLMLSDTIAFELIWVCYLHKQMSG